jgi:hypothetical protein
MIFPWRDSEQRLLITVSTTLRASTACDRDSFTFLTYVYEEVLRQQKKLHLEIANDLQVFGTAEYEEAVSGGPAVCTHVYVPRQCLDFWTDCFHIRYL